MKKEYFVIYFGEDGISISRESKTQIEARLAADLKDNLTPPEFVDGKDNIYSMDSHYPAYKTMIIKGEVVVPKVVEIVKKYEI